MDQRPSVSSLRQVFHVLSVDPPGHDPLHPDNWISRSFFIDPVGTDNTANIPYGDRWPYTVLWGQIIEQYLKSYHRSCCRHRFRGCPGVYDLQDVLPFSIEVLASWAVPGADPFFVGHTGSANGAIFTLLAFIMRDTEHI